MFFLELKCPKCYAVVEVYSQPNQKLKSFKCPSCDCRDVLIQEAHDLSANAWVASVRHLEGRLKALEEMLEASEEGNSADPGHH